MAWDYDPFPSDRPPSAFPAYTSEEENSLLSKLGGATLSGLGWMGQTLAKPGRVVRGLLGGKPREALNVLPFSDTLGITDPSEAVSGRDLLYQAGLTGAPEKGFEWEDIPGFGVDVLTDPLSYFNPVSPLVGGSLTKAGLAAKKAGSLAPRLSERIAQGQAGLFGSALGPVGTGATAQKLAGSLGNLYDKAAYGTAGLHLGNLFNTDRNVMGRPSTSKFTAQLAEDINPAIKKAAAESQQPYLDALRNLHEAGLGDGTHMDLRTAAEGGMVGPFRPEEQALIDLIKQGNASEVTKTRAAGLPITELEGRVHRQMTPTEPGQSFPGTPRGEYPLLGAENKGREDMFGNFKLTRDINQILKDPTVSGIGAKDSYLSEAAHIRDKIPGYDAAEHGNLQQMVGKVDAQGNPLLDPTLQANLQQKSVNGTASAAEEAHLARINRYNDLQQMEQRSHHIADFAANLDPKYAKEGLDYFGQHVGEDVMKSAKSVAVKTTAAGKITDALAKLGVPGPGGAPGQPGAGMGPGMVRVTDTLSKMGFDPSVNEILAKKMGLASGKIHDVYIPQSEHDALTRMMTGFSKPEATKPLLQAIDTFQNAFKIGNTVFWPAKYIRDFSQQVWSMFVGGHHDPRYGQWDPRAYLQPMMDAHTLIRKGGQATIEGAEDIPDLAARGLSNLEASREVQNEMFAHKIAGPDKLPRDADMAGLGAHAAQGNIQVPGEAQAHFFPGGNEESILGMIVPKSGAEANPLNTAGILGKTETQFGPVKAGRELMGLIDDSTRGGSYIALRRQGYTPAEAAKEVVKVHYDYTPTGMTPFEKSTMKRLMPFYSWLRPNMPRQLQLLAENPGGVTSRAIQESERVRQKQGFLPEQMQDTFAMPLGGEEKGTQRYLSRSGLPFEDAFSMLPVGHGGLGANVMHSLADLAGELTPGIKAPMELAAGKQFFTGRSLESLEPRSGRILSEMGLMDNPRDVSPVIEQILMNSPIARGLTTLGTAMDPRKGLTGVAANLASPLRVTDVDMNRQRDMEGQRILEELLRQSPNAKEFQNFYIPKELQGKVSPDDVALMRLQATLQKNAKERAKQRKLGPES